MPHLCHPLLLSLLADTSKGGSREGRPLPSRGRSAATERRYVASRRRPGGVFRRDPWRGGGVWDIPLLPPPPNPFKKPLPQLTFPNFESHKKVLELHGRYDTNFCLPFVFPPRRGVPDQLSFRSLAQSAAGPWAPAMTLFLKLNFFCLLFDRQKKNSR